MYILKHPVIQIFQDGTISKIENQEILKKMNKKYVDSKYWYDSYIIDTNNLIYQLKGLKIIDKKFHFNFYDLFYTTLEVKLELEKLVLDELFLNNLNVLFGETWGKLINKKNIHISENLFQLLEKFHDLQLKKL